ncbi:MAG TPA: 2-dehydro-3-deoxyphosphogluconate aldolase, partial [Bacteroidota bacterium]|nr:2-dehydro-3-deoxyphosphogluconate aldolase [Bacteroidota bacterium]
MMTDVLATLELCGIIPVVVIDDDARAVPLANALVAGGLST